MFNVLVLCAFFFIFIPEYVTLTGGLCMNFNINKRVFFSGKSWEKYKKYFAVY